MDICARPIVIADCVFGFKWQITKQAAVYAIKCTFMSNNGITVGALRYSDDGDNATRVRWKRGGAQRHGEQPSCAWDGTVRVTGTLIKSLRPFRE